MGSPIWSVNYEKVKGLSERAMIVGADVFHTRKRNFRSVLGFSASLDKNFTQFFNKVTLQAQGQEIMSNIGALFEEALKAYFKINKYLPDQIIFYRDGVGQGQILHIIKSEIPEIKRAFLRINLNYFPKFCEILITKRINDRFFLRNQQGEFKNPISGTLVHKDVVFKEGFDFFLVSQKVTQGTCTPTHFQIISNETNLSLQDFTLLSFFLCFNYYNWPGAVKVPAVVQYAHKIAYFVGKYIKLKYIKNILIEKYNFFFLK